MCPIVPKGLLPKTALGHMKDTRGICAIYTGYSGNYETKLLQSWENMVVSSFYVNTLVGMAIILMWCMKTSIVVQLKTRFDSPIVTDPPT